LDASPPKCTCPDGCEPDPRSGEDECICQCPPASLPSETSSIDVPTSIPAVQADCECPEGCYPEVEDPSESLSESADETLVDFIERVGSGESCETAFAFPIESPGHCFHEDGFNRWGWTIGPLGPGVYTFPVYAGAGQCDLEKGTEVGQLKFVYDREGAKITYASYSGYKMTGTHFNIGSTPYPMVADKPTVSPGLYTAIHDELRDEQLDVYTFNRFDTDAVGQVYIIAHAVSCPTPRRHLTSDGCSCVCPTPTDRPADLESMSSADEDSVKATSRSQLRSGKTNSKETNSKKANSKKANSESTDDRDQKRELEDELDLADIIDIAEDADTPVECRVAFGYHSGKISSSFEDLGFVNSGFGWSNGPFASSNYEYSLVLYAKEGDGVVEVGSVIVEYDGDAAVVSVDAGEGFWLKNVHAYVGTTLLPRMEDGSFVADPAQYPFIEDKIATTRVFTVSNLEEYPVYVVTETTVCGVFASSPKEMPAQEPAENNNALKTENGWMGNLALSVGHLFQKFL
jgi:hypothetical protein